MSSIAIFHRIHPIQPGFVAVGRARPAAGDIRSTRSENPQDRPVQLAILENGADRASVTYRNLVRAGLYEESLCSVSSASFRLVPPSGTNLERRKSAEALGAGRALDTKVAALSI